MSTSQNTEYMDARRAAFNNVGRDQINADQVIINPNSLGALGKTILALLHAHFRNT